MTKERYEELPEGPNEGHGHFYDKNNPAEEIAGIEYAIKHTKHRIANDPDRPAGVFEEHLANLQQQLKEAKAKPKK